MSFPENLYKLRKKNGLSQEELADKLNVSRQSISKWELGTSLPETEKLIAISKFFNVSLDYLISDEELTDDFSSKNNGILNESKNLTTKAHKSKRNKKIISICLLTLGIILLSLSIVFILLSSPVSEKFNNSSMIFLNGNAICSLLSIIIIFVGLIFLLKNKRED